MHYGRKAFSKNGLDTIRPKDKSIFLLGNDRLSELDIKQANQLSHCDGKLSMFIFGECLFPMEDGKAATWQSNLFTISLYCSNPFHLLE